MVVRESIEKIAKKVEVILDLFVFHYIFLLRTATSLLLSTETGKTIVRILINTISITATKIIVAVCKIKLEK